MKPIPFPTKPNAKAPNNSDIKDNVPLEQTELAKEEPAESELKREDPTQSELNKEIPDNPKLDKDPPETVPKENCIVIDGKVIEIKPTKLKYFRNKMASAYAAIKAIPLNEFLAYGKGVIDPDRDADQVLYDFLVAAFDDPLWIKDHYDELTAEDVERVIEIFGRLNHIDEKEEKVRKNKAAQAKP